jgi:serine/threonine protein kinase
MTGSRLWIKSAAAGSGDRRPQKTLAFLGSPKWKKAIEGFSHGQLDSDAVADIDATHADDRPGGSGSLDVPPTVVATTEMLINRRLGRGGLGDVYAASDRSTGRSLAVKFLNATASAQATCREAFALEARVTSQLEHPNIVPVYVTGEAAGGRPYYAMRLIQGRTLAAAIADLHDRRRAHEPAEERTARYTELLSQFALICKAIAYAHDRGVIHRDIKPANVMLGRFGEVVVLDWGLAERIDRDDRARSSGEESILMPTMALEDLPDARRALSGTPAYMSPEQHDGGRHVGTASDVYGLGATLYHLLTGEPPHAGDVAAIRERVLAGRLEPPTRVRRGVSPAIEAVCLKAMAHDPADRYDSPLDLARDVEHYLADLPVTAYREPFARRLARWTRRHRTFAQVGLAALMALLLVTGGAAVLLRRMAGDEYRARQTALTMAARLAADTAALQIDARWRILEHEAVDDDLVRALEAHEAAREAAAATAVNAATAGPVDRGRWPAIQAAIERIARENRDAVDAESWVVCDAVGVQVARSPVGDTIGQSFSHRDYFHGGDGDLPVGTPAAPLVEPHRSTVYKSMTTGRLKVAFSVPVWSDPPEAATRRPLGVLVMTFDVGLLFRSIDAIAGWNASGLPFAVAVIDLRDDLIDGTRRAGLVLENPDLLRTEIRDADSQEVRAPPAIVARLRAAGQGRINDGRSQGAAPVTFDEEVPTIAAAEAIVLTTRPRHLADVGWAVLVQER